jgi:DNA-directed RNA polymerase beta subunit
MSQTILTALIGLAAAALGTVLGFLIQARRLPAEIKLTEAQAEKARAEKALTEAQAEKAQHEAASQVIQDLTAEVNRLKAEIAEVKDKQLKDGKLFEERLTKAEARATGAESRLADSESRASEFRRAVIALGERLDRERAKSRGMVVRLVGIIEHLLDCVEDPGRAKDIDRPAITRLIQSILDEYPAEQFVKVV